MRCGVGCTLPITILNKKKINKRKRKARRNKKGERS
jgi:hypothetical protein